MSEKVETDRQTGIELLRIICTVMIIFSHAAQYMGGGEWWKYIIILFRLIRV